jgi:DNA-binding NtrC family response regulator
LGAVADRAVDVKLLAATSADLPARVPESRFRLDLYHRLAVVLLELPPLRARGEDILELTRRFLRQYAAGHGVAPEHLGPPADALHQLGAMPAHADPLDVAQAETHYQQALALVEALGRRPLVAHCHLGLGTLYGRISRAKQARTKLTTAIELYRTMDMPFRLPQAEAALAQPDT